MEVQPPVMQDGQPKSAVDPIENFTSFLAENGLPDDHHSAILYQVHQDLLHVRKWTDLRVFKTPLHVYLTGCAARMFDSVFPNADEGVDRTQVVIPIAKSDRLSPRALKEFCEKCLLGGGRKPRCVTVAIVDDDTTTAYYRLFDTWDEIVHPQWKQKKKEGEENEGEESVDTDSDGA